MKPHDRPININAIARKVDVDNRIQLHLYYRIADNLLKQANVYREERNLIDLYIMLLRFSSLVSETIPLHRDYQALFPREKKFYRTKLLDVIDELESLKPDVQRLVSERNIAHKGTQLGGPERISYNSVDDYSFESPLYAQKEISRNFIKSLVGLFISLILIRMIFQRKFSISSFNLFF